MILPKIENVNFVEVNPMIIIKNIALINKHQNSKLKKNNVNKLVSLTLQDPYLHSM